MQVNDTRVNDEFMCLCGFQETKQLHHPITAQCLDADPGNGEIFMNPCDAILSTQQWQFEHVNSTAIMND